MAISNAAHQSGAAIAPTQISAVRRLTITVAGSSRYSTPSATSGSDSLCLETAAGGALESDLDTVGLVLMHAHAGIIPKVQAEVSNRLTAGTVWRRARPL